MIISAEKLPATNVSLDTHTALFPDKHVIGYSGSDNQLIMTFLPKTGTQMDPSGNGKIKITMPPWWTNADLSLPFYNPSTPTPCTMNCANVL